MQPRTVSNHKHNLKSAKRVESNKGMVIFKFCTMCDYEVEEAVNGKGY